MKRLLASAGRSGVACGLSGASAAFAATHSVFAAAGLESTRVLELFWAMLAGGAALWLLVVGLSAYAIRSRPRSDTAGVRLIIWGGCVLPTVLLAILLYGGLRLLPALRGPADGPTIAVSAERFWWRVAYGVEGGPGVVRKLPPGGVPSANEIWLPVGRRSTLLLGSPDVIHSLWVPPLAGKMDAIPGRVNRLVIEPKRTGVYQGRCAEFCGAAHAMMGLRVVVVSEAAYREHVRAQAAPAAVTAGPGPALFVRNGCAACHTVRGTDADGRVGPDLTHLASRGTLAGGVAPATAQSIAAFIRSPGRLKPGAEMPAFGMLPEAELDALAQWLGQLE